MLGLIFFVITVQTLTKIGYRQYYEEFKFLNVNHKDNKNVIRTDTKNKRVYFFVRKNISLKQINTLNRMNGVLKYVGIIFDSTYSNNKVNSI